jgi:hypothetical protein
MRSWTVISTGFLVALTLAMALVVVHPIFRGAIRTYLNRPSRRVLSVAEGDLFGNGSSARVMKVRTEDGLFLEVYGQGETEGDKPLLTTIHLPDRNDGYFHFRGEASNLALDDVDNDHHIEIIAPTFDENSVAHLNIYRYNPAQGLIEPMRTQPM